jgi:hypothetical protein
MIMEVDLLEAAGPVTQGRWTECLRSDHRAARGMVSSPGNSFEISVPGSRDVTVYGQRVISLDTIERLGVSLKKRTSAF